MINGWSYINDYAMVFPRGFEKNRKIGAGSIVIEEDYTIYFMPNTPEDLKQHFVREYAEYHIQKVEEQRRGLYIDD